MAIVNESWREVPGHPDYEVSDLGRVRRATASHKNPAGTIVAQRLVGKGYMMATLFKGGRPTNVQVHRLVLLAFEGPPPSAEHESAHWDRDRGNNRLSNLRWATRLENAEDKRRHGTMATGERQGRAILSGKDVGEMRYLRRAGFTFQAIANNYGVSRSTARAAINGDTWRQLSR